MPNNPQLVPYWDAINQQFQGPGNVPHATRDVFIGILDRSVTTFQQNQAVAATATVVLGIVPKAGKVIGFQVAAITPPTGNATYTVDLFKNGASILSAVVNMTSAATARTAIAAALNAANTPVQAGDFFEAVIVSTPGTGTAPAQVAFTVMIAEDATLTGANIPLGIASRSGIVAEARVGAITPPTGTDIYQVDILRNGVSILSAPMQLSATQTARQSLLGTLAVNPTLVAAGDFFEASIIYTHGTGVEPIGACFEVTVLQN